MKKKAVLFVTFYAGLLTGCLLNDSHHTPENRLKVLTVRDTVIIERPSPVRTVTLPPDTVILAAADCPTADSCTAIVPLEQTEYAGEGYRAYVSGYRPALDSLIFEQKYTTIYPQPSRIRFNIGLQAGYGLTPKGLQPYLGLGITCTLTL